MINMSMLVDHVKARLGVSHRQIEFDDQAIVRCLTETTLKTISVYAPFYCTLSVDLSKNEVMPGMNTFFVPEELGDSFIVMGIEKIIPYSGGAKRYTAQDEQGNVTSTGYGGGFTSSVTTTGLVDFFMPAGSDIQNIILSLTSMKMSNMMGDTMINPLTFEFIPPNMVRLSGPLGTNNCMMIARTTHKKDFSTIPFGMIEAVKDLAFYDVAMDIYSIRKYFQNVRTLFAEINLDMDTFQQVPDKRTELIERLRRNQLKYGPTRKIYVV